jgi:hypothetical protein
MGMWPNFRSPLMWDVFAVSTYFTVVAPVLVHGPHPRPRDAARPREDKVRQVAYGLCRSAGAARTGTGSYERAYLILAALSTPLVLSVHSVVSFDFATSQSSPAGTRRSSRRTSSPAPSSPASPW